MNAVLNFAGAIELEYGVSFAKVRFKDIIDYMIPERDLLRPSRLSHVWYVRYGHLMTKNAYGLPLLISLNDDREDSKKLGVSKRDSDLLHATQSSFIGPLIEAAGIYINNLPSQQLSTTLASTDSASSC